jgi:hypothetical protein
MLRAPFRIAVIAALVVPSCSLLLAQNGPPAHAPSTEAFEQYLAYWTAEPGWRTELQLRNNLEAGDLTVTVTLRTADGIETDLPTVKVPAADVVSLDLSATLPTAAPKLVGAYGSLVLKYTASVYRALYVAAMVRMNGQPIAFHLDGYPHPTIATRASREGIWWLPRESVTDFLILANSSNQKLNPALTLYDSSGEAWRQPLNLGPHQTLRLSVRTLLQQAGLSSSYGGIKIDGADTARYLESAHLLFVEQGGFSANMKMFDHDPDVALASHLFGGAKEWTTRAPMLALSQPDPALGFPAGTALQPQVFVRNTSGQTYTAHVYFNWRSDTASGKTAPINLPLRPNATQLVDVAALQAQKIIPPDAHWAAVILSAPVQPDDLMAVAASYDQTGRYGAQTPFSDQLASHWEAGKWEVDSAHDSLVTIGNGGSQPTRAGLTILYNHGSGQYRIEQALAPDEQVLVDFGKLIRSQIPDKDGHTLPSDLTSGTYRLRDLNDSAAGTVYEGKVIVDKTYGHAAYGCMICCGATGALFEYNPLGVPVGSSTNQQVQSGDSCGGGTQIITGDFPTWWTDNTKIATANGNKITGVAVGTTMHHATSKPMYFGLREYAPSCPFVQETTGGNANVGNVSCSPSSVTRGGTTTCTATGPSGSTFSNWKFVDGAGNPVNGTGTSNKWSGVMVTGGTVSVTVTSSGGTSTPSASITVNNRTNFAFTAVNPTEAGGSSITCYGGANTTLPSPPVSGSYEGGSCPDLAFSFQTSAAISDNGPNNGYQYVTSVSDSSGGQPTQFQYIVVTDLLSPTTFYNAQCGNYSSNNSAGFIAGSQLKQNVFDHEQGSVFSHWTEYRDAQNNSNNNIGTVLEAMTAPPNTSQSTFKNNLTSAGQTAINNILTAVANEPCNRDPTKDSSQSCDGGS